MLIVTALCTTRPDPASNEFEVVSLHPGVAAEQVPKNTGWAVQFAVRLDETPPPTEDEIDACGSYSSARRGRMDPLDHPGLLAGSLLEAD